MKLHPDDGLFTKAKLIDIARYYYPSDPRPSGRLARRRVLAPLYFIGEVVGERSFRDPIDDEFQTAAELLKREMLALYPYHPLEHSVALTMVPGLQTGYLQYGETTLIDLLMTSRWDT